VSAPKRSDVERIAAEMRHGDADTIRQADGVSSVWTKEDTHSEYEELTNLLYELGIPYRRIRSGEIEFFDPSVNREVLQRSADADGDPYVTLDELRETFASGINALESLIAELETVIQEIPPVEIVDDEVGIELDDGVKRNLIEMARRARCSDEERGDEDQVARFNAFKIVASSYMTDKQRQRWDAYSMKADNNEIVDDALRLLQVEDDDTSA